VESAPQRPEALAVQAREALGLANQALATAELQFAATDAAGASAAQQRASLGYDALCARIANGFLAARAAAPAAVSDCASAKALAAKQVEEARVAAERSRVEAEVAATARAAQEQEEALRRAAHDADLAARKKATAAAAASKPAAAVAAKDKENGAGTHTQVEHTAPLATEATDEQQVRATVTRWCSAANRGDTLEMEKRAAMTDALRATFDKRTVGFDEQRCRIQSLEADGAGYVVSVPIEQIQKDGAMSNVMRQFIARLRVAREGDAWHIQRIEGAEAP
jgi:hypothetical protein